MTPQDSQTLTADYVQVRRADLERAEAALQLMADHAAGVGYAPSKVKAAKDAADRLRAAIGERG